MHLFKVKKSDMPDRNWLAAELVDLTVVDTSCHKSRANSIS